MTRVLMFVVAALFALPALAAEEAAPAKPATTALAPITIADFARLPFLSNPELSPNGVYMAAETNIDGETKLAIFPLLDQTARTRLFSLTDEKASITGWQWVNDDWMLVYITSTVNVEGEDWQASRVVAINRSTSQIVRLLWKEAAQNAARVIWTARDGTPRILLGIQRSIYYNDPAFWTQVYEVDVSTGKAKPVVKSRSYVMDYYADAAGNVRLGRGYNDNSRTTRLIYRPNNAAGFKEIDRASARRNETVAFPSLFLADTAKALTWSDTEGHDAIYELDLTTLERGKKVFGLPGYDVDAMIPSPKGDGLAGAYVTDKRTRAHWIDPTMAAIQADVDAAVGAGNALAVSWSRDWKRILFKVGGPDQAGIFYIYQDGRLVRVGYVDETLKARKLNPVSTIRYKAGDGLDIEAVLTLPKDKPAKNLPLIMLPHGGPGARDSESWDWWVQFLAWRGYAVIQPNYRGSTGYGADFFDKGDGEFGRKMQDDLNDAITHLASQGIADPKRVCIAGASYGGYAALVAGYRDAAKYRCLISYAGVADLKGIMRYDGSFLNGNSARDYWKSKAMDLEDVSPLRNAARFAMPSLIMHGTKDLRVPVKQSRQMAAALKSAGKPVTYIEQPLGDHHFSRTEDRMQFLQQMDAFLKQHNPAD